MVLQHAGFDYVDETVSLLGDFPNVHVDMSVLNSVGPARCTMHRSGSS
jgi:predicted TIM-barrel fold metal-dependent hydrolase